MNPTTTGAATTGPATDLFTMDPVTDPPYGYRLGSVRILGEAKADRAQRLRLGLMKNLSISADP